MTKMNRRNYLSLLGVSGAGLMIGAACNKVGEPQSGQTPTPGQSPAGTPPGAAATPAIICSRGFKDWPTSPLDAAHPPSRCSSVTLIFDGLLGYFYNKSLPPGEERAEVGFLPAHKHVAELKLWKKANDNSCQEPRCTEVDSFDLRGVRYIDLKVEGRANKVDFYKPGECLDRIKGTAMDFRWLPDLGEFYTQLKIKKDQFKPVVRIKDGTFYTRMITTSLFQRVDSTYHLSVQAGTIVGRVAHVMAAAITLASGQRLVVERKDKNGNPVGESKPVEYSATDVFELQFVNRCPSGCDTPEPCHDSDETKRNDFHYMRKVLDGLDQKPKYSIALAKGETEPLPIPAPCADLQYKPGDYCGSSLMRLTDEAPCAGAGYGGGGGCNCL